MNVRILQGVNIYSPISTIEIELAGEFHADLENCIKKVLAFNELFGRGYEFDTQSKKLRIFSKLTHLWREAADAINRFSKRDIDTEGAEKAIIHTILRAQVYSMSTIPILEYADKMNYEISQMLIHEGFILYQDKNFGAGLNRYYVVGSGRTTMQFISSRTHREPVIAQKIQKDKWLSNSYVERIGMPLAKWKVVESLDQLKELFDEFPKPCVIKPIGLTAGHGVTTNIQSWEQAERAYQHVLDELAKKERPEWQQKIMIQQQVSGDDYRLLVIDGKFRIATRRIPAFVIGNGEATIRQLIEEINTDPRRDLNDPTHILKPILFDELLTQYLEEQNLNLEHTPAKDEKIFVRKVASMSQGGITEDVTEQVHPQIKLLAESIAASMKMYIIGIDVICRDIAKPLTIENGSFIEMNMMPEIYLNAFPVIGQQHKNIGEMIVDGLIERDTQPARIVVVGGSIDKALGFGKDAIEKRKDDHHNVTTGEMHYGVTSNGEIYVDSQLMREGLTTLQAIEAIKLNAILDTVVIHHPTLQDAISNGLGFDQIDQLFISSEYEGDTQLSKIVKDGGERIQRCEIF